MPMLYLRAAESLSLSIYLSKQEGSTSLLLMLIAPPLMCEGCAEAWRLPVNQKIRCRQIQIYPGLTKHALSRWQIAVLLKYATKLTSNDNVFSQSILTWRS